MIALEKKNTSKSPDYNQFLFKKMFEVSKKQISSNEKLRNSGNLYLLTRSLERIFNTMRYTGI